ncbi:MAG: flagellar basal body-associated protein FliL [Thermodesulfovibrionales bacterium]
MAEDTEGSAEEREEPKKKKSKNMLLVIIIAVAVLAGGGGAFFFLTKSGGGKEQKKESHEEPKKEEGVMVALDPFVVNLSDNNGNRFLKVTMQLEVAGPAIMEKAKNKTPQLRDAVITLLTSKTSDALVSPEGKLQLKDEVNIMANQILGSNSVKNVYLTDFVMQ